MFVNLMVGSDHLRLLCTHIKNSSWQTAEPLCRNTVEQADRYKSGFVQLHILLGALILPASLLSRRMVVVGERCRCKCRLGAVSMW